MLSYLRDQARRKNISNVSNWRERKNLFVLEKIRLPLIFFLQPRQAQNRVDRGAQELPVISNIVYSTEYGVW